MPTTAYAYQDDQGRLRALSFSRSDTIRNARLNGASRIAHVATTPRGTVPALAPSVIRWETV